MKYSDIAGKSAQELQKLLKEKRVELFTLKMKQKTMQLQKTSEIRDTRKSIAHISTALSALDS
ncbi:MAG: 50S ribosomal protein L29 [Sulfuricurvum sp. PC08-66]|nr:MAG: 50S ribosomal protein L29 [Sulfuricurvum sp. PC08-66]